MQIDVISISGRKLSQMTIPAEIFNAKINNVLMVQAARVFSSNQRQSPAKTKRRGEINLSGRKIYRQKGTGRARHGDKKPGIFVKGAKAHGPTGEQNFKLKISKKMRRLALYSALSYKFKEKEVMVMSGLDKIEPKTKQMTKVINHLINKSRKFTFVLPSKLENVIRAGRNIAGVNLIQARQLNAYQVLNAGQLVFMKESIEVLKDTFIKKR